MLQSIRNETVHNVIDFAILFLGKPGDDLGICLLHRANDSVRGAFLEWFFLVHELHYGGDPEGCQENLQKMFYMPCMQSMLMLQMTLGK